MRQAVEVDDGVAGQVEHPQLLQGCQPTQLLNAVTMEIKNIKMADRFEIGKGADAVAAEHEYAEGGHRVQSPDVLDLVVVQVQEDKRPQRGQVLDTGDVVVLQVQQLHPRFTLTKWNNLQRQQQLKRTSKVQFWILERSKGTNETFKEEEILIRADWAPKTGGGRG